MGFIIIPNAGGALGPISLADHEKQLLEQGEIIVREVETVGKSGKTFEAIGIINASSDTILEVLSEYEKYPDYMPNVSHIEIIEETNSEAILNYTLTLPLGKIKKYRLKLVSTNLGSTSSMIHWQLLNWPGLETAETIKDTNGFWRIEEQDRDISLVQYHVYTDPGPIPFGLGWIVDILSNKSVPEAFLQTKSRVEKLHPPQAPQAEITVNTGR
jgi:ribosome-associated toxin RatA of RatAB toxin-antitoxin module